MFDDDAADTREYDVVVNGEEQYSVWPVGRPLPAGWRAVGFSGRRAECLSHVEEIWVDMRPLSVRSSGERRGAGHE